jgi:hypothetical protein
MSVMRRYLAVAVVVAGCASSDQRASKRAENAAPVSSSSSGIVIRGDSAAPVTSDDRDARIRDLEARARDSQGQGPGASAKVTSEPGADPRVENGQPDVVAHVTGATVVVQSGVAVVQFFLTDEKGNDLAWWGNVKLEFLSEHGQVVSTVCPTGKSEPITDGGRSRTGFRLGDIDVSGLSSWGGTVLITFTPNFGPPLNGMAAAAK